MIGIIDYGSGNVGSVLNMFSKIGLWSEIITKPDLLPNYKALVLPGVGSFDNGIKKIKQCGYWEMLDAIVKKNEIPILGICLGMQMFFEESDEGTERGFGWLPGKVSKFKESNEFRVPHIAWNNVKFIKEPYSSLENSSFYFVHSFHAPVDLNPSFILGTTSYGITYPSAVQKGKLTGFQFHPEKSLIAGMELLQIWNSLTLIK